MCRLEEQGCAEVAEAGGSGWLVGALPPCWSSSRCSKQALEGQTARALNLTSGGDRAELSFAEWGRVSQAGGYQVLTSLIN